MGTSNYGDEFKRDAVLSRAGQPLCSYTVAGCAIASEGFFALPTLVSRAAKEGQEKIVHAGAQITGLRENRVFTGVEFLLAQSKSTPSSETEWT